ncbi:coatomer subunit alpha [Podila humilis]|nr:coatomer subunit alpha [Podila humilis]
MAQGSSVSHSSSPAGPPAQYSTADQPTPTSTPPPMASASSTDREPTPPSSSDSASSCSSSPTSTLSPPRQSEVTALSANTALAAIFRPLNPASMPPCPAGQTLVPPSPSCTSETTKSPMHSILSKSNSHHDRALSYGTASTSKHLASSNLSSESNSASSSTANSPRTMVRKRQRLTAPRKVDGGAASASVGPGVASGADIGITAGHGATGSPVDMINPAASARTHATILSTLHDRKGVSGECYACISNHLVEKQDCPPAGEPVNYFLQEREAAPRARLRYDILQAEYTCEDIDEMMSALSAKKRELKAKDQQVELEVLMHFLKNTKAEKEEALARLNAQIHCLDNDMRNVQDKLNRLKHHAAQQTSLSVIEDDEDQIEQPGGAQVPNEASEEEDEAVPAQQAGSKRSRTSALTSFCSTISKFTKFSRFEHINTLRYGDIYSTSSIVSSIEFDRDDEYFATAGVTKKIKIFEYGCIEKTGLMGTSQQDEEHMDSFDGPMATTNTTIPSSSSSSSSSMGSSSNKKPITSVLHYPILEMTCRSKIRHELVCLSWNSYIKSQIASSDYEGIVSLWDAQTGVNTLNYDEHEKRAWSVDFSRTDPTQLASGSDDTKVKIWSVNQRASVCTIESKANICCVKFNPESSHHIAFGSADHHIHYYDLRKANEPLFVFKGHRKAVSYVKFLGREELVSASTDSTLKLWNTSRMTCVRTYTGHCNEKNFVGLSASGDWISCGSENNSVYTYYKELRDPVVTVKFGNSNPVTGEDTVEEDPSQFVSSVCWKKDSSSNILLAANSSGVIKVLRLV